MNIVIPALLESHWQTEDDAFKLITTISRWCSAEVYFMLLNKIMNSGKI